MLERLNSKNKIRLEIKKIKNFFCFILIYFLVFSFTFQQRGEGGCEWRLEFSGLHAGGFESLKELFLVS